MQEYTEITCKIYYQDASNDYSEVQEEVINLLFAMTFQADSEDGVQLGQAEYWPDVVKKLVTDLLSPNQTIAKSAYLIIINLSHFPDVKILDGFRKTPLFEILNQEFGSENENLREILTIIGNFALSGDLFLEEIINSNGLVEKLMFVISDCSNDPLIFYEALKTLLAILSNTNNNILTEFCVNRIEMWDVVYLNISESLNKECMLAICSILETLFEIGIECMDSFGLEENPFVQRIIDNNELSHCLESSQNHGDRNVYKHFYGLVNHYFDFSG